MKSKRAGTRILTRLITLMPIAVALVTVPMRAQEAASAKAALLAPGALVGKYCVYCHNAKTLTAGVSLEGIDFSRAGANAAILERVLHKVSSGEMAPAGAAP